MKVIKANEKEVVIQFDEETTLTIGEEAMVFKGRGLNNKKVTKSFGYDDMFAMNETIEFIMQPAFNEVKKYRDLMKAVKEGRIIIRKAV